MYFHHQPDEEDVNLGCCRYGEGGGGGVCFARTHNTGKTMVTLYLETVYAHALAILDSKTVNCISWIPKVCFLNLALSEVSLPGEGGLQ